MPDVVEFPGFPGYELWSTGEVFSYKWRKPKRLKPGIDGAGYPFVILTNPPNSRKTIRIHREVALNFLELPEDFEEVLYDVHHKDKNKENNRVENLFWVSRSEHKKKHKPDFYRDAKKVIGYTFDAEFSNQWPSIRACAEDLKTDKTNVSKCCRGIFKAVRGSYLFFEEDIAGLSEEEIKKKIQVERGISTSNIAIDLVDSENRVVESFSSARKAAEFLGSTKPTIIKWADRNTSFGLQKSFKGLFPVRAK